jgi:hypothetical protein
VTRLFSLFRGGGGNGAAGFSGPRGGAWTTDGKGSPEVAFDAARVGVMSATLVVRDSDEGPRVLCLAPALGGSFVYDRQDAKERVERHFPALSVGRVKSIVALLHGRVVDLGAPRRPAKRRSWVNGWREW